MMDMTALADKNIKPTIINMFKDRENRNIKEKQRTLKNTSKKILLEIKNVISEVKNTGQD